MHIASMSYGTLHSQHQSYAASLKEVHAPSALSQSHLGEDLTVRPARYKLTLASTNECLG